MEVVFWVSVLFLFYTFIGYPIILIILKKIKPENRLTEKYRKPISVVMVACNESAYIKTKIENILSFDFPKELISIVIVDDCSDDETAKIVDDFNDERITLLRQKFRSGKAAGLNLAFKHVKTELTMLLDSRQKVTLNALADLSSWFKDEDVVAVSGEVKFLESDGSQGGMDAYQKYEGFIRKSESKVASVPGVSGAVYMLRTDQFKPIAPDTILDDVLIPMTAAKNGGWVGFDERVIAWDIPSDDWEREKKRKTRTLNGNYQLLFRNLSWCTPFGHNNWFAFVSHKVTRLLAPIFMLLAAISSGYMGFSKSIFYLALFFILIGGILVYPSSLLLPALNRFKLIRIASAFVALNWFNILGFISYLSVNKKQSWK